MSPCLPHPPSERPKTLNILAVGAHPDDVENFCGGTLLRYAQEGHRLFIAIATRGDIGAPTGTRDDIAARRRAEAQAAADVLGAELIWLGYDDEFLFNTREVRLAVIDAIRQARADVVLALSEDDYHPDHRTIGTVVRDARIPASVPLIESRFPATPIPTVFVMDTYDGSGPEPDAYVDVTDVESEKVELIRAHRSQEEWMNAVFSTDMEVDTRARDRRRGESAGVSYAESFRLLRDYPSTGGIELLPSPRIANTKEKAGRES